MTEYLRGHKPLFAMYLKEWVTYPPTPPPFTSASLLIIGLGDGCKASYSDERTSFFGATVEVVVLCYLWSCKIHCVSSAPLVVLNTY